MCLGIWDHHDVCLPVNPIYYRLSAEAIVKKLDIYITTPQPILTKYFHQSMCLAVYPLPLLGNYTAKFYRSYVHASNNRRIIRRVVFYEVRDVSRNDIGKWSGVYVWKLGKCWTRFCVVKRYNICFVSSINLGTNTMFSVRFVVQKDEWNESRWPNFNPSWCSVTSLTYNLLCVEVTVITT
jgi:hypothetical protein